MTPNDKKELAKLAKKMDLMLPAFHGEALNTVGRVQADNVLPAIKRGYLVLMSRGMFKQIVEALQD